MSKEAERRETAKQVRAAAKAQAKRDRMIRNIGAGVVVALVVGIIAVAYVASRPPEAATVGAIPASVNADDSSWTLNPSAKAKSTLVLWEDFQCPSCRKFEQGFVQTVDELAKSGVVNVVYRPTAFLDDRYPGTHSARSISAWGCAIDAGVGLTFHTQMYANQPATEGKGWTDDELVTIGVASGIATKDQTTFATCVKAHKYMKWATDSTKYFNDLAIPGTPNIQLDGVEVKTEVLQAGAAAFKTWVTTTAKK